jgi:8-oxo-dGTP pyrophosphatase MutT (NUDIX family)
MPRFGRRLRSRRDYALFQITIAFIIGLGAFLRDVRELRRRWSDYEFTTIAAPFPPLSAMPSIRRSRGVSSRPNWMRCSNDMCTLRITHRETGDEFDPRRALLANADGRLRTIGESMLADCVGISTLAVTADGALVMVRQTSRNVASALILAPAGSGSLDPRDLGHDHAETLQDIVRRGMERELCEETGIRPDEIRGTRVTGFARWLERGAKPEFFGLTELSATTDDLAERRHLASDERLYTGGTITMTVDIPALGRELVDGTELLMAPSLPARIKEDGSLPLLLALRAAALRHASASRPGVR